MTQATTVTEITDLCKDYADSRDQLALVSDVKYAPCGERQYARACVA